MIGSLWFTEKRVRETFVSLSSIFGVLPKPNKFEYCVIKGCKYIPEGGTMEEILGFISDSDMEQLMRFAEGVDREVKESIDSADVTDWLEACNLSQFKREDTEQTIVVGDWSTDNFRLRFNKATPFGILSVNVWGTVMNKFFDTRLDWDWSYCLISQWGNEESIPLGIKVGLDTVNYNPDILPPVEILNLLQLLEYEVIAQNGTFEINLCQHNSDIKGRVFNILEDGAPTALVNTLKKLSGAVKCIASNRPNMEYTRVGNADSDWVVGNAEYMLAEFFNKTRLTPLSGSVLKSGEAIIGDFSGDSVECDIYDGGLSRACMAYGRAIFNIFGTVIGVTRQCEDAGLGDTEIALETLNLNRFPPVDWLRFFGITRFIVRTDGHGQRHIYVTGWPFVDASSEREYEEVYGKPDMYVELKDAVRVFSEWL